MDPRPVIDLRGPTIALLPWGSMFGLVPADASAAVWRGWVSIRRKGLHVRLDTWFLLRGRRAEPAAA